MKKTELNRFDNRFLRALFSSAAEYFRSEYPREYAETQIFERGLARIEMEKRKLRSDLW